MSLLSVQDMTVRIGELVAVDGISFDIERGHRVGIVGESGAGKSLTAMAILGLLPGAAHAVGTVQFEDENLLDMPEPQLAKLRGRRFGTVFQDPLTALNPVMRVGRQVGEVFRRQLGMSRDRARHASVELLASVGLPDPEEKARAFPHQLSGGQRQRVMIAMAMASEPEILVADEPTTALDVTIQLEILTLIDNLIRRKGTSLLLITHDLPVISNLCDTVVVMYGGRIVESGPAQEVLSNPQHPYTAGLMRAQPSAPRQGTRLPRLPVIPGVVPPLGQFPAGCGFRDRCSAATLACEEPPVLTTGRRSFRCWHPLGAGHDS